MASQSTVGTQLQRQELLRTVSVLHSPTGGGSLSVFGSINRWFWRPRARRYGRQSRNPGCWGVRNRAATV